VAARLDERIRAVWADLDEQERADAARLRWAARHPLAAH
jgi:hypothetical protein